MTPTMMTVLSLVSLGLISACHYLVTTGRPGRWQDSETLIMILSAIFVGLVPLPIAGLVIDVSKAFATDTVDLSQLSFAHLVTMAALLATVLTLASAARRASVLARKSGATADLLVPGNDNTPLSPSSGKRAA